MAASPLILLNIGSGRKEFEMETRLIIAYILLALLGLVALAGAIVVARARRDHRR
jgi:hypothetical protein